MSIVKAPVEEVVYNVPVEVEAVFAGDTEADAYADRPDSVHRLPLENRRDRHSSGPGVARPARCHLPASHACGTTSWGEPRAGLLGVAARRDCPFHPDSTGSSLLL